MAITDRGRNHCVTFLGESVKGFKKAIADEKPQDAAFDKVEAKSSNAEQQKTTEKEQA